MMRVLLDTNVVLDYLLDRQPFAESAAQIMDAHKAGHFEGFVSVITPLNVFYITRRLGRHKAFAFVKSILDEFSICPADANILHKALSLPLNDYEDAAQAASALAINLDAIVTRDKNDFDVAPIAVYSPSEFLQALANQQSK